MTISSFSGNYRFLSNFYPSPVAYGWASGGAGFDGEDIPLYPTVEHAFQAAKFTNTEKQRLILEAATAAAAKKIGRTKKFFRSDWEEVKFKVMEDLLQKKFSIPELRNKLAATGNEELVEGNHWHDNIWGDCDCVKCKDIPGQNNLGKLLMKIRAEIKPKEVVQQRAPERTTMATLKCVKCGKEASYPADQLVHGRPILTWFKEDRKELCADCFSKSEEGTLILPEGYKLGWTGHRPNKLGGYQPNDIQTYVRASSRLLMEDRKKQHPDLINITGMALGVDQWVAEDSVDLGIPFIAAIPFTNQDAKWPQASKDHYHELLSQAALVVNTTGGENYKPQYMQQRNIWMVDHSDEMACVWNGDESGGTWNCVEYIKKVDKKRTRIDPTNAVPAFKGELPDDTPDIFKFACALWDKKSSTATLGDQTVPVTHHRSFAYTNVGELHYMTQNMEKDSPNTTSIKEAEKQGVVRQITWATKNNKYIQKIVVEFHDSHIVATTEDLVTNATSTWKGELV